MLLHTYRFTATRTELKGQPFDFGEHPQIFSADEDRPTRSTAHAPLLRCIAPRAQPLAHRPRSVGAIPVRRHARRARAARGCARAKGAACAWPEAAAAI